MRMLGTLAVWFGLAAQAAGPNGPPIPLPPRQLDEGPTILIAPSVQRELAMTEAQAAKVPEAVRDAIEHFQQQLARLSDVPSGERFAAHTRARRAMMDEVKQSLGLDARQAERFDQIILQQRGPSAFDDPGIRERLRLTAEQKRRLAVTRAELQKQSIRAAKEAKDADAARAAMVAIRRSFVGRYLEQLDEEQRAAWRSMTGAPFEIGAEDAPQPER